MKSLISTLFIYTSIITSCHAAVISLNTGQAEKALASESSLAELGDWAQIEMRYDIQRALVCAVFRDSKTASHKLFVQYFAVSESRGENVSAEALYVWRMLGGVDIDLVGSVEWYERYLERDAAVSKHAVRVCSTVDQFHEMVDGRTFAVDFTPHIKEDLCTDIAKGYFVVLALGAEGEVVSLSVARDIHGAIHN